MVTTRSQEKRGHDTPEPSSIVVDISAAPESKTPSTASKKRTTPRARAAQDTDARKGLEKDAESAKSSLVQDDDATPTANNKTVPYRQKATESFFTPAQTPANKRKRFTSEELEDSTLDTFETPAEHPQSRHEYATTTEEEHADDDDDAPEVVSSKTAAEQVRALRSRGPSSAGRKRRRTAVDQESFALESDTIEVLSTTGTTNEKPVQVGTDEAALLSDGTAMNDQPGAEVTTVQVDEESTHQAENTNASIIVETATTEHEKDDQTQEPPPASDDATKPVDDEETTPTPATEEKEARPSDDQTPLNGVPLPDQTTNEVQPQDEPEASPSNDLTSSAVPKHTSALPSSAPETQGTPDTTFAQPTVPTPSPGAAKSAPEPSPHHRPLSGSSLLERKANPPKPSSSILSQRQRAAILREHRPAQKPLTTSSLDAYRSRVLDRHPRTSAWGAPGQRKVRFVGA